MRSRVLILGLSFLMGMPIVVSAVLLATEESGSESEVPVHEVEFPAALSHLSDPPTDLAVDDSGAVWYPLLGNLYRYDPPTNVLQGFDLPGDPPASTFVARIELGRGAREGKLIVAWEATLLEVDGSSGAALPIALPLGQARIDAGPRPPTTRIMDIAMTADGTLWASRDNYPYLIAVYADGSSREFALPAGSGSPDRLAIDGQGRIWATLHYHRPVDGSTAGNLTVRLDPKSGRADILPWQSWNVAGRGGKVVAIGGRGPATVRRFDVQGSNPVALTDFGPTFPGDELTVGADGAVWYRSRAVSGLVHVAADGSVSEFALPVYTGNLQDTGCPAADGPKDACEGTFTSQTPVDGIAVAPDGSAWFSAGDRIGHAVP